jgi:hypothetical protein
VIDASEERHNAVVGGYRGKDLKRLYLTFSRRSRSPSVRARGHTVRQPSTYRVLEGEEQARREELRMISGDQRAEQFVTVDLARFVASGDDESEWVHRFGDARSVMESAMMFCCPKPNCYSNRQGRKARVNDGTYRAVVHRMHSPLVNAGKWTLAKPRHGVNGPILRPGSLRSVC